ncbi:DUF4169 family protein [Terasakiella sp. SH-1]|uniref:DUF4169 family protein n=1 Tax=Terasakiella sp. SH-1 TaxID=2560057 RepID=UPI001F118381|nr:DUF4169 family protein [Terasakiella sp. SH-1]
MPRAHALAEIINLRQKRKQKARLDKDKRAEENRVKFGRTKAQKKKEAFEAGKQKQSVDDHKLD